METIRAFADSALRHKTLLSASLIGIAYIYMLQYAIHFNMPLRVHQASIAALFPWLILTILLVGAAVLGSLQLVTQLADIQISRTGPRFGELLAPPKRSTRVLKIRGFTLWLQTIALPLAISPMLFIALAALDVFSEYNAFLTAFALAPLSGCLAASCALRRAGYHATSRSFWALYFLLIVVSGFVVLLHAFYLGIPAIQHLGTEGDPQFVAAMFAVVVIILLVIYACFRISQSPPSPGQAGLVLTALVSAVLFLGLFNGTSSFAMIIALSINKLGGGIAVQYKLDHEQNGLTELIDQSSKQTIPLRLILDEGELLRVTRCSDREMKEHFLIPRAMVLGETFLSRDECLPAKQDRSEL